MNPISILMYHSIDATGSVVSCAPQDFAGQMTHLKNEGFRGVSLSEAVAYRAQHGSWPEKTVALTFDDGFANVYEHALPVLTKHRFTATVFVITDHMGGLNDWARPPAALGTQRMLSWEQASELAAAGIEIGSHTRTHPDLRLCGLDKAQQEMTESRQAIEENLSQTVKSFAYPYGGTSQELRALAANEFGTACTTELRRANGDSLEYLPRIDMYYIRSQRNLQRLLGGQLDRYLKVRSLGRVIRGALITGSPSSLIMEP